MTDVRNEDRADLLDQWESEDGSQSVQYSGRKAFRAKSEQRRLQILEATLRIAVKDGIRAIKHRSVAKEAGVPLASTTYYFKDINELINDAFILFAEKSQEGIDHFYAMINMVLDGTPPEAMKRGGPGREALVHRLASIVSAHLSEQLMNRRDAVLAEHVFLMEALRDPALSVLARQYHASWVTGLERMLERLDSQFPLQDANMLVSVGLGLGYDGLLYQDDFEARMLTDSAERLLGFVMGLPQCPETCPGRQQG
ncbi:TetR/AcrR family transcriptional regulator [Marinobacter mobilis]|nr:TetR family transcriptional regulator [Marinobacter mobilis]